MKKKTWKWTADKKSGLLRLQSRPKNKCLYIEVGTLLQFAVDNHNLDDCLEFHGVDGWEEVKNMITWKIDFHSKIHLSSNYVLQHRLHHEEDITTVHEAQTTVEEILREMQIIRADDEIVGL